MWLSWIFKKSVFFAVKLTAYTATNNKTFTIQHMNKRRKLYNINIEQRCGKKKKFRKFFLIYSTTILSSIDIDSLLHSEFLTRWMSISLRLHHLIQITCYENEKFFTAMVNVGQTIFTSYLQRFYGYYSICVIHLHNTMYYIQIAYKWYNVSIRSHSFFHSLL